MVVRSLGKSLLGKSSPFQLFTACLLGSMLGFVPGFWVAPMTVALLLATVAVLNVNLALAAMVTLAAKAVSLLLVPVSHGLGSVLLDGPIQGVFGWAINAPVLALCGFEYYGVTGGLALGSVLGVGLGFIVCRSVKKLRVGFVTMSQQSDRFESWSKKASVKWTCWLLLGIKPKRENFEKLAAKKMGNPVRVLGVVFTLLVAALVFVLPEFLSGPILTHLLRTELERANGATVELGNAEIDLSQGRMVIDGLALVDADDLQRDAFRAVRVEIDISTADLLTKRVKFDRVIIAEAVTGAERATPGKIIEPDNPPPPEAIADTGDDRAGVDPTLKTLDEVVKDAKEWKGRLERAEHWLEWLRSDGSEGTEATEYTDGEELEPGSNASPDGDRSGEIARHLIEGAPTLHIVELQIERLEALQVDGRLLRVSGYHLSTQPSLLDEAPRLSVQTHGGDFELNLDAGALALRVDGIDGDRAGEMLEFEGTPWVQDGSIDVSARGTWSGANPASLSLPIRVTLKNTRLRIPGMDEPQLIEELELPVRIEGALRSPGVFFDNDALIDALVAAGRAELARQLEQQLEQQLGMSVDEAKQALNDKVDESKQQLIDEAERAQLEVEKKLEEERKQAELAKKKAEAEAKQRLEAEAKKKLEENKGLLDGFLGGGRKKDR